MGCGRHIWRFPGTWRPADQSTGHRIAGSRELASVRTPHRIRCRAAAQRSARQVEEIRSKQKEIAERILWLQRLVRVIPTIRELDAVDKELAAFLDLPPLRDGFADATQAAVQTLMQAEAALAEAEERRAALAAKIDTLTPSWAILAVEASIRDIKEKAVHVDKARGDRANPQTELAEINAKLDGTSRLGAGQFMPSIRSNRIVYNA
jgi:DNA repair exonuclease SbcCD ATPase subunit